MIRRFPGPAFGACALLLLLLCPFALCAADAKPEPKDAEPTGPDYAIQGEYTGEVITQAGNAPVGIQVIALGNGKFKAVGFPGGLPGAGWDRSPRKSSDGELKDGVAQFKSDEYSSTIKKGTLSISVAGVKIADLKKVDRESATLGESAPEGAIVLFDGSSADNFENGKMTEDGLLLPGCTSKEKLGSGKLHIEFRVPFKPDARDQARGNSGIFVQGRYEVQVLDSFGLEEADNGCGAIYSLKAPEQNMCYPPGAWQTYDIDFTAAEYQDGKKVKDPVITVRQNGVAIDRKTPLPQASPGAPVAVGEEPGPINLQDHGNPVRYRNIWFVKKSADKPIEKASDAK
jgi:hypothetical protein